LVVLTSAVFISWVGEFVTRTDWRDARRFVGVRVNVSSTFNAVVRRRFDGWSWFVSSNVNILVAFRGFSSDGIKNSPGTNNVDVVGVLISARVAIGDSHIIPCRSQVSYTSVTSNGVSSNFRTVVVRAEVVNIIWASQVWQ
jgi:hypothetical protein